MLRRSLPILILLAGVGIFVLLKLTRPAPHPVAPTERIWRIEAVAVQPSAQHPILPLFGQVEAPDRVQVAAPVAGRLLELRVRDGEQVAAGTVLGQLDPRDLQPRVTKARAELEKERLKLSHDQQALAQEREILRLAQVALERAETVQAKQLGSVSSVDDARERHARAQLAVTLREQSLAEHPARLAALEAVLSEAERDLARGTLRAPFAARIGVVKAAAGDQLQANQTLLTLYPLAGLYVRAKIPGRYSDELRQALAAGEQLTASGQSAGRTLQAVLERLSGEADARGVDALLKLAPDAPLPLGALVELRLQRPLAPDTIAVPVAALHGGDRLFAVRDGRLQSVPIERVGELDTGAGAGQVLLRVPTLQPGERVMTTHLPNAIDTLKVEVVE
ncbi:HlyD family secretion protein [Allochromatium warmingii]|uniref:HlyD family secretion protein n=1 Tax=Allochromatium warmingii TaxID=61595 RepID=A0A1H3BA82_ALLWA|nr:HlyD family efflux transporter periplasmic adaptor subunit [Allochromatium warmingii]SDX38324.1 HlyD family secretion protein [Allochromatium warmingii]